MTRVSARRTARILIIRLSALGDVLLATPLVAAFASQRPEIEVEFLTRAGSVPALAGHPHLAALHVLEERGTEGTRSALSERGYDFVLDLSGTLRSRLLALSLGVSRRTAGKFSLARRLMVLRHSKGHALPHVVERYFDAARDFVRPPVDLRPEIHLTVAERDAAARWLGPGAPAVALFPGARWATKAWPPERYRELAERLAAEAGARALLFVPPGDGALAAVLGGEGGPPGPDPGVGVHRQPFRAVAGILERSRAAVANDSAMMHLASATRTPLAAFFGPTVPEFGFRPLGAESTVLERDLPCRPCSLHGGARCPLGHHDCLRGISVEEAFRLVVNKMRSSATASG